MDFVYFIVLTKIIIEVKDYRAKNVGSNAINQLVKYMNNFELAKRNYNL